MRVLIICLVWDMLNSGEPRLGKKKEEKSLKIVVVWGVRSSATGVKMLSWIAPHVESWNVLFHQGSKAI